MNDKKQMLSLLQDEFERWEKLLASLSEEQITAPQLPAGLSIKDTIAHLMAWQQRSIARLEAAKLEREPVFPDWPAGLDPEVEDVDAINAWIYDTYRDEPWSSVYHLWQSGFLHLMELGQAIPEKDLLEAGKYPWLGEYTLLDVLQGWYEHHHQDHLEPLVERLRQHGD
jgi:hypothetical protein